MDINFIFQILILIFSIVIHEVSHGAIAYSMGDPTAKHAGRLTLNPLKHLDPVGSVIVPILLVLTTGRGFGWAKPVPVNPYNFRDQRYGSAKVSFAGPMANLIVALFFGLLLRFFSAFIPFSLVEVFYYIIFINVLLMVFNLLPIPPLDGSHILFAFLPRSAENIKLFLTQYGIYILIFFIFLSSTLLSFLYKIVSLITVLIAG